ncbi:MAG: endonuclease/exonuclease/phosphatase family protein [Phycisphaerales bacterium JB059]
MRILAWNILHGGGARRAPEIALSILAHQPDMVVLSEFRRSMGGQIAGVLGDHALNHQFHTAPAGRANGLLIASRHPLRPVTPSPFADDPSLDRRWLDLRAPDLELRITGVHIPDAARGDHPALARKSLFWRRLLETTNAPETEPRLIVGDFNTGRARLDEPGDSFTCTPLLGELVTRGYADAYRLLHADGRDPSWISHTGSGFRLDHAYVSPPLCSRVRRAEYSHQERESGLSDHAPMLVELAPRASRATA